MLNFNIQFNNYAKPNLYCTILAKIRVDAKRHHNFTLLKYPTNKIYQLKAIIHRLQNDGLIIGISNRYEIQNTTYLRLYHACVDNRPIRRAELVMKSNIKYNRTISVKQIRKLLLWGYGSELILATTHGVVTAQYCLEYRLGGRILGSIRG